MKRSSIKILEKVPFFAFMAVLLVSFFPHLGMGQDIGPAPTSTFKLPTTTFTSPSLITNPTESGIKRIFDRYTTAFPNIMHAFAAKNGSLTAPEFAALMSKEVGLTYNESQSEGVRRMLYQRCYPVAKSLYDQSKVMLSQLNIDQSKFVLSTAQTLPSTDLSSFQTKLSQYGYTLAPEDSMLAINLATTAKAAGISTQLLMDSVSSGL